MKHLFSKFSFHKMDEMEIEITLKAKSYAQLFTMLSLFLWAVYEIIRTVLQEDYQGTWIPWMILLISLCIESLSKQILQNSAIADDDEYETTRKQQLSVFRITRILMAMAALLVAVGIVVLWNR